MKKIIFSILLILLILPSFCFSQKNPSLKFSVGLAIPAGELGGNFIFTNDSGVSFIDQNFLKENYATSTGATITGTLKFPLEKSGILNGTFIGSYSYFNAFKRKFLGTTVQNSLVVPVTFDRRFSASTFGIGIELNPVPEAKISPFVNTNLTLNILSLTLTRNEFSNAFFNDAFRIGVLTNAGVAIKINNEYSVMIGGSYHLSNLLLKSSSDNINDRAEFGREGIPFNDGEGLIYTNLSNPDQFPAQVMGKTKNVNWWNINIGLNIALGKTKKK
ncbi:MAG: hypothetical protein ABIY50_06315 [Ignavibacteria bacterium]